MTQTQILLLDDHPASTLATTLLEVVRSGSGLEVQVRLESLREYRQKLKGNSSGQADGLKPDLIFVVLNPVDSGESCSLFQLLGGEIAEAPIIAVTESRSPEELFGLIRLGAADFITPPLKEVDILPRVWRLIERSRQENVLLFSLKEKMGLKQLIGVSASFVTEVKKIPLLAKCDATVLISGETGTGKELCAQAIHYLSGRSDKPFVPVNCGAIPVELAENEFFGHERGAFTSASASQYGLIHEANGGTLFLDEIDSLPTVVQIKLLRFLQEKEYRPLGSTRSYSSDVRVIAGSNADLEQAVNTGQLRRDLYYRLNVLPLALPPLRERREDIPLLARHFLANYSAGFKKRATNFSVRCMQALLLYDWPGNVRELQHAIERAVALCEQEIIRLADLALPQVQSGQLQQSFREAKARVITQFEKNYIQNLLLAHDGNITKAAEASRKNRRAFWQLMRKYRIEAARFRTRTS